VGEAQSAEHEFSSGGGPGELSKALGIRQIKTNDFLKKTKMLSFNCERTQRTPEGDTSRIDPYRLPQEKRLS
jgi:hypothetical protein